MTRSEAIKAFFFKSVLPVTVALILYCIFKSACVKNGEVDYVWLWILCGLPFGLPLTPSGVCNFSSIANKTPFTLLC